jgi:hypothetical protein
MLFEACGRPPRPACPCLSRGRPAPAAGFFLSRLPPAPAPACRPITTLNHILHETLTNYSTRTREFFCVLFVADKLIIT